MKEIFKNLLKWMTIWLGFFLIVWIGYFFIKARSSSNPGTTDSNPTSIYVSAGETLTAAKRNTMINKQVPIWSIVAWHKSLSWTPSLPDGWVECKGQTLSDATSPYNGQVIPDLNNAPSGYNWWRFLRWGTTSWVMQEWSSVRYQDWFISQQLVVNDDGIYNPQPLYNYNTLMDWSANNSNYARVRPVNMSVVWIMKIK